LDILTHIAIAAVLQQAPAAGAGAIVAADGTGQYRTVQDASCSIADVSIFADSLIAGHVDFIFGGATA